MVQLILELVCVHSDMYFSLISQRCLLSGLLLFLYLNKTCFILTPIHP